MGGNEVPEIEITPAMIEAGVEAYSTMNLFYWEKEDAVEAIYRAMAAKSEDTAHTDCQSSQKRTTSAEPS